MWRGEDDSKAQPDVAGRRWGWQRLGVARRGGRAAGPGTRESRGGRRASRTRSERAAAGRAGPVGSWDGGATGCLGQPGW